MARNLKNYQNQICSKFIPFSAVGIGHVIVKRTRKSHIWTFELANAWGEKKTQIIISVIIWFLPFPLLGRIGLKVTRWWCETLFLFQKWRVFVSHLLINLSASDVYSPLFPIHCLRCWSIKFINVFCDKNVNCVLNKAWDSAGAETRWLIPNRANISLHKTMQIVYVAFSAVLFKAANICRHAENFGSWHQRFFCLNSFWCLDAMISN